MLAYLLAYNGDVAAGRLAVFRGGPSRTGGKAPISGFIRVQFKSLPIRHLQTLGILVRALLFIQR